MSNSVFGQVTSLIRKVLSIPRNTLRLPRQITAILNNTRQILLALYRIQEAIGRIEARQLQSQNSPLLSANEFQVYSQWGEDGIIQYLLKDVQVPNKIFVEFGVESYKESNTRFLLVNNNWSGLILDGSPENIQIVRQDPIYWKYNLKAVHAFVTEENINTLLTENGVRGEIGLLSVDIDGNDYWVWLAIDVIQPAIVIVEYNFRFGKERAVTVPYDPKFVRRQAHHSMIYYGASLKALCCLAHKKGYAFVGCNRAGNNAFFVLRDLKPDYIPELTSEEGYIAGTFREARTQDRKLAFLSHEEEQEILASLPVVDVC